MTEKKNQLASLFAACWKDEALKARFMSDPKAVLTTTNHQPLTTATNEPTRNPFARDEGVVHW